jgi:hypothetical protein
MRKRRYRNLMALLARAGWQPRRATWTVPYRDDDNRPMHLRVTVCQRGTRISFGQFGAAEFTPQGVARLRAALRETLEWHARLSGGHPDGLVPRTHPGPAPTPHNAAPLPHTDTDGSRVKVQLCAVSGDPMPQGRHAAGTVPASLRKVA